MHRCNDGYALNYFLTALPIQSNRLLQYLSSKIAIIAHLGPRGAFI